MTSAILIALLITAVLPSLIRFYRLESNNQGSVTGSKLREIKRWLQYHSPEKKKLGLLRFSTNGRTLMYKISCLSPRLREIS